MDDNMTRAARLSDQALRYIVANATEVERGRPTPELPLAGSVHVSGIGRISFSAIEDELKRRPAA